MRGRGLHDVRTLAVVLGLSCWIGLTPAPAAAAEPGSGPVIAVIDSGIDLRHESFAPGQVTAWWNFAGPGLLPKAGQTWDPRYEPHDEASGHGTATAAMAAGLNVNPAKTPSLAPGTKLAIAKVTGGNGTVREVGAAVRWAVNSARADVVSISLGGALPMPGYGEVPGYDEYDAFEWARSRGALVVVSNGNGLGNTGLAPAPGAMNAFSSSLDVLAVGAAGQAGLTYHWDPEVAAQVSVVAPVAGTTDGYRARTGTSYATPLVAGFAARLFAEARAAGHDPSAGAIERLLKYAARDTDMPPFAEGYGVLDAEQLPAALEHARNGTLPPRPSPDVSGTYVEEVAGRQRALSNGRTSAPPDAAQR